MIDFSVCHDRFSKRIYIYIYMERIDSFYEKSRQQINVSGLPQPLYGQTTSLLPWRTTELLVLSITGCAPAVQSLKCLTTVQEIPGFNSSHNGIMLYHRQVLHGRIGTVQLHWYALFFWHGTTAQQITSYAHFTLFIVSFSGRIGLWQNRW